MGNVPNNVLMHVDHYAGDLSNPHLKELLLALKHTDIDPTIKPWYSDVSPLFALRDQGQPVAEAVDYILKSRTRK